MKSRCRLGQKHAGVEDGGEHAAILAVLGPCPASFRGDLATNPS